MLGLGLLLALIALADRPEPVPLQNLGRMEAKPLREVSGIIASRQHPGIYWVHNDSGNPPRLFAIRREGTLVREFRVNVPNVDWEDIASDDQGHLYIGDTGNNDGVLPLRVIYRVKEPDPAQDLPDGVPVESAVYYRFRRKEAFDCEGLAIDDNRAYLVAKTHDKRDAEVYTLPLDPPAPLLNPAVPERAGTLKGFTDPATGADLTRDGRILAVSAHDGVGLYERKPDGSWKRLDVRSYRSHDDIEAVTWDGADLILAGEERGLFRIRARDLQLPPASNPGRR